MSQSFHGELNRGGGISQNDVASKQYPEATPSSARNALSVDCSTSSLFPRIGTKGNTQGTTLHADVRMDNMRAPEYSVRSGQTTSKAISITPDNASATVEMPNTSVTTGYPQAPMSIGGDRSSIGGGDNSLGGNSMGSMDETVSLTGTEINAIETALQLQTPEASETFDFADFLVKRCGSNAVLAFSSICLLITAIANSIFFKKMTNHMVNYPWFLAQLSTVVYVPVFFGIVWLSRDSITEEMRNFPKSQFFIMGVFDAFSGILAMFGGVHTSGSIQALLSNAIIPFTMILAYLWVNERFSRLQVLGATVIMLGVGAAMQPSFTSDGEGGLGDTRPFFVFLYFLNNLPSAVSSVYKEVAFKDIDMDVNYLQAWVVWWQLLFGFVLIPLNTLSVLGRDRIAWNELPSAFMNGLRCLLGYNYYKLPKCHPNPVFAKYYEYEDRRSNLVHSQLADIQLVQLAPSNSPTMSLPLLTQTEGSQEILDQVSRLNSNSTFSAVYLLSTTIARHMQNASTSLPNANPEEANANLLLDGRVNSVSAVSATGNGRLIHILPPVNSRSDIKKDSTSSTWNWDSNGDQTAEQSAFLQTSISLIERSPEKSLSKPSATRIRDADADRVFFQSSKGKSDESLFAENDEMDFGNDNGQHELPECDACQGAWIMVTLYLSFNMLYNYFMIVVIKHGGASLMYIIMTLRLPLVQLAFSVRSINDPPDVFGWAEALGLIAILTGMAMYKQGEPEHESIEIPADAKAGEAARLLDSAEQGYGTLDGEVVSTTERTTFASTVWSTAFLHSLAGNAGLHHPTRVDIRSYQKWRDQQAEARRQAQIARAALFRKKTALQQRASYYSKLHSQMQEARRGVKSTIGTSPFAAPRNMTSANTTVPSTPPIQSPLYSQHSVDGENNNTKPRKTQMMVASNSARRVLNMGAGYGGSGTTQISPLPGSAFGPSPLPLPPIFPPTSSPTMDAVSLQPHSPLIARPSTPRSGALGSTFFTPHRERIQQAAAAAAAAAAVGGTNVNNGGASTLPSDQVSISSQSSNRIRGFRLGTSSSRTTNTRAWDSINTPDVSPLLSPRLEIGSLTSGHLLNVKSPTSPLHQVTTTTTTTEGSPVDSSSHGQNRNDANQSQSNFINRPALQTHFQTGGQIHTERSPPNNAIHDQESSTPSFSALPTHGTSNTPRLTSTSTPTLYVATNAPQNITAAVGPAAVLSGVDVVVMAPGSRQGSPFIGSEVPGKSEGTGLKLSLQPIQTSTLGGASSSRFASNAAHSPDSASLPNSTDFGTNVAHERYLYRSQEEVSKPLSESTSDLSTVSIMPLLSPLKDDSQQSSQTNQSSHDDAHKPTPSTPSFVGSTFESIGSMRTPTTESILTPGDLRRQELQARLESGVPISIEESEEDGDEGSF